MLTYITLRETFNIHLFTCGLYCSMAYVLILTTVEIRGVHLKALYSDQTLLYALQNVWLC